MEKYDVIVVGASFAGLSVASRLKKKVLLIDRHDIGTFQTSACGAPYDVIKEIGCEASVLQVSDIFSLHVNSTVIDFGLEKPYCTFDFGKFCRILNSKNQAEFLKASVKGVKKNGSLFILDTSEGEFSSGMMVDATGWEASVAQKLSPGYIHRDMLSFGIETEAPYRCESFHFFYEPGFLQDGVSWIFPCGEFSRIGVASYTGARKLIGKLDSFLHRFNLKRQSIHGGSFCYCLKEPVVEDVFVVGCAQGQTLPFTGEWIRRCITYGIRCGEIIEEILDGTKDLNDGQEEYSNLALDVKRGYSFLLKGQDWFLKTSERKIEILARIVSNRRISKCVERWYRNI